MTAHMSLISETLHKITCSAVAEAASAINHVYDLSSQPFDDPPPAPTSSPRCSLIAASTMAASWKNARRQEPAGLNPEQKITVEEAVRAYTVGSAYAEFAEGVKGSLASGMLADVVIVDRDMFSIHPIEIEQATCRPMG
jgi:hypothetical protein